VNRISVISNSLFSTEPSSLYFSKTTFIASTSQYYLRVLYHKLSEKSIYYPILEE
jgi:hypothetical protein